MYVLLLGLSVLLVLVLKHKLQSVETDLRAHLSRVIVERDTASPEMWAYYNAQSRVLEGLLFKHFYTED
jgi:hypothetical protein